VVFLFRSVVGIFRKEFLKPWKKFRKIPAVLVFLLKEKAKTPLEKCLFFCFFSLGKQRIRK
jgi:hypothetical protein